MLDENREATSRAPLSAAQRATPASVDLIALCRSLPADGHLSDEDLEVLKDWTARYRDIALPSQQHIKEVIDKALAKQVVTADDRQWMYGALEPALPLQLRKETQQQRLLAELAAAEEEGGPVATISLDFLVAGVHVEDRWQTIESRVHVGDAVWLVRDLARRSEEAAMLVMSTNGECIGLVPEEEARLIIEELDRGGRVEAVVKKILTEGQFPIPVIGSRVHCIASEDEDAKPSDIPTPSRKLDSPRTLDLPQNISAQRISPQKIHAPQKIYLPHNFDPQQKRDGRWQFSKRAATLVAGLAGGVLVVWALFAR